MDPHSDYTEIISESSSSTENFDLFGETKTEIPDVSIFQLPETKIEIPDVSIFQVPETITTTKPEAFKPQLIGFGPHRGPEKKTGPKTKSEQRKRFVVQRILHHYKINEISVVDKVLQIVLTIRESYEMLLQDDDASLARDFVTDGLFLLNLLQSYPPVSSRDRLLAPDILMVENQIPFMVLKEIHNALPSASSGDSFSPNSIFQSFCEAHSPLELCSPPLDQAFPADHLLNYMYYSIFYKSDRFRPTPAAGIDFLIPAAEFVGKLPQREIVQLYQQIIKSLQKFSECNISIPSASKLHGIARLRFQHLPDDNGIGDIKFKENCLHLPCITLNDHSEVILRNLVAYETLMQSYVFPLTTYMGLMCWLVADVEDVKILRKENIIKGGLSDEKIAKIFVEMHSFIGSLKTEVKSKLRKMIDKISKVYESMPLFRVYLFMKKLANWLLVALTALGSFVGVTWKIVAFLASIVTMFMLSYQAYCDIYGCKQ